MKQKLNRKEFINQNYMLVHEVAGEDDIYPRISIYKAKVMQDLPTQLIDYLVNYHNICNVYLGKKTDWGNCDWGVFDAFYTSYFYVKKGIITHVKIYVNAILRRPFTIEQQRNYEKIGTFDEPKRIYLIYDSANDDNPNIPNIIILTPS